MSHQVGQKGNQDRAQPKLQARAAGSTGGKASGAGGIWCGSRGQQSPPGQGEAEQTGSRSGHRGADGQAPQVNLKNLREPYVLSREGELFVCP